jgi:hypothetical protein
MGAINNEKKPATSGKYIRFGIHMLEGGTVPGDPGKLSSTAVRSIGIEWGDD